MPVIFTKPPVPAGADLASEVINDSSIAGASVASALDWLDANKVSYNFGNATVSGTGDIYAGNYYGDGSNLTGVLTSTGAISDSQLVEDYIKTSEVDGSTIEFAGNTLNIVAGGVTSAEIASSVAGAGLGGGAGSALSINVDNSTVRVNIDTLEVISSGITHANLSGLSTDSHTQYSLVDGTRAFTGTVGGITPVAGSDLATKTYVDTASGVSDHGHLTGNSDDDHPQYILADGSRAFSAVVTGVDPVSAQDLATKNYVDTTATGITDHGHLSGRSDDDHPQYVLADGSRAFSAVVIGVDPSSAQHLATKNYVDTTATGITDHGNLSNLSDDDHPQYILADGTRNFSATVIGVDPVAAQDLATKNYVDTTATGIQDHGHMSGLSDDDHPQYVLVDGTRDFTGVVIGVDPVSAQDLATKNYVDTTATGISDHGHLSNLSDDDHPQYVLADGSRHAASLIIDGNLIVNGTQFITNTETVLIEDNLLVINNGEVGAGVTEGEAGIEVDRGSEANYRFMFDETNDYFVVGISGSEQPVATRETNPTSSGIPYWNGNNYTYITDPGFIYTGGNIRSTAAAPVNDADLTRKDYVDAITAADIIYNGTETIEHILDDTINGGIVHTITVNNDRGGLTIDWSAGKIWDVDNAQSISTVSGTDTATNNAANHLIWTSGSTLTLGTTDADIANGQVSVAHIACQDGIVYRVHADPILNTRESAIVDAMTNVLQKVVTTGLIVSEDANATNDLDVILSPGVFYHEGNNRHEVPQISSSGIAMVRHFHTGGVWDSDTNAEIDTSKYDDGTNLAAHGGKWYKSLFIVEDARIHWIYPIAQYNNTAAALAAPLPTIPPGLDSFPNSTALVYQGGDTALPAAGSDRWIDVRPTLAPTATASITDHGNLGGLNDDDHTIYILADGTRAFTAAIGGIDPTSPTELTTRNYVDVTFSGTIDHNTIVNNHNLTTDIDHDALTNFAANEHFTEASIDHGSITGLGDNDHTQYVTITSGSPLSVENQTIGFTQTGVDHGSIAGLSDDDHPQYLLAAGTRALTGDWNYGAQTISGTGDVFIGGYLTADIKTDRWANLDTNTLLGVNVAGGDDISGANNTAFGYRALYSNTNGVSNTAVGAYALDAITTGDYCTAVGHDALTANTANNNTAVGYAALALNEGGLRNTAVGINALDANVTGNDNTAVGANALGKSTVAENTAVGQEALKDNSIGTPNTAVGAYTLRLCTTGLSNTAVGAYALDAITTGDYCTAVGHNALAAATGGNNVALGYAAGDTITAGDKNTFLGTSADADNNARTNSTAIGYNTVIDADNKMRMGDANVSAITGTVDFAADSDIRQKQDIVETDIGLEFIMNLKPKNFRMKANPEKKHIGLVAQDVKAVMDELNIEFGGYHPAAVPDSDNSFSSLTYGAFVMPLINAVKELTARIEELENK